MDIFEIIGKSKNVVIGKLSGVGRDFFKELKCRFNVKFINEIYSDDISIHLSNDSGSVNIIDLRSLLDKPDGTANSYNRNKKMIEVLRSHSIKNNCINIIKTHKYSTGVGHIGVNYYGGDSLLHSADLVITLLKDELVIEKNRYGSYDKISYDGLFTAVNRKRKIEEILNFSKTD